MPRLAFRPLQVTPCEPGWRAVFTDTPTPSAVVAWALCEVFDLDDEDLKPRDRGRQVCGVYMNELARTSLAEEDGDTFAGYAAPGEDSDAVRDRFEKLIAKLSKRTT